ncbi:hypothetical protein NDU88_004018 [Pleurodeles waltl]|uniref:Uncharacterized protein n=1 Tax=Pleurodeles waltl TaxID=8319 RepID=A0AAV7RJ37_PLEWA|nr:hypothetical protein NDU88_004018 [Pleurodeles waltl]
MSQTDTNEISPTFKEPTKVQEKTTLPELPPIESIDNSSQPHSQIIIPETPEENLRQKDNNNESGARATDSSQKSERRPENDLDLNYSEEWLFALPTTGSTHLTQGSEMFFSTEENMEEGEGEIKGKEQQKPQKPIKKNKNSEPKESLKDNNLSTIFSRSRSKKKATSQKNEANSKITVVPRSRYSALLELSDPEDLLLEGLSATCKESILTPLEEGKSFKDFPPFKGKEEEITIEESQSLLPQEIIEIDPVEQ